MEAVVDLTGEVVVVLKSDWLLLPCWLSAVLQESVVVVMVGLRQYHFVPGLPWGVKMTLKY